MKIRIAGTSAEVAAEVERLSALYHVRSESEQQRARTPSGQVWVYLDIAGLSADSVLLPVPDVEHALAALHALAAGEGLDPISAGVAERIGAALAAAARSDTVHPVPDTFSAQPR
ncbi:hypothetical protein ACGFIV_00770 [Sphaerisporangium sp. NPDC049003]|uniref:hypothetical protein n=1 Tax=Sphaerisporangium sp. NPDC049003 TaxID=3364517 RepID=UPI003711E0B8